MPLKLIPHGWSSTKTKVKKELQPYCSIREKIEIIDETAMKSRRIILPGTTTIQNIKTVIPQ